jgi:putative endonuclease
MYYLYLLLNEAKTRTYVGVTEDLNKRLVKHNAGRIKSSSPYRPYKIIYTESYETLTEDRRKEKFYKSITGRRKLKEILKESGR